MSKPISPEIQYPFPEERAAAYGLFLLTHLNALAEDSPIYTSNVELAVVKAIREWETDPAGTDRVVVNRRGDEIFRASTLLLSAAVPRMLDLMMKRHENQKRKGDGADYREHPLEVAHILRQYGFDADTVAAGLGHDLLEDTDATEMEIARHGNVGILKTIKAMTQPEMDDWYSKKLHHVAQIQEAGAREAAVFVADHIANLRSMLAGYAQGGEAFWANFNAGKEGRLWYEQMGFEMAKWQLLQHPMVEEYAQLISTFQRMAAEADKR